MAVTTTPVDGSGDSIENLSNESRLFPPSAQFVAQANFKADIYTTADADRLAFWETQARELTWDQPWSSVLDWQVPYAKWFVGGKLNASVNALDRHVAQGRGSRVAFHFEGEPGDTRTITYADLLIAQSLISNQRLMCIGVPQMLAGLPVTPMLYMDPLLMAQHR